MMTLSDEEAIRVDNSIKYPKLKSSTSDEAKQILTSWYFNGDKIQYSGKMNPAEDDWIDYTKSEFPVYTTFVQYKWKKKKKKPSVKRCRVALVKSNGIIKPLLVMDYDYSLDLMNLKYNEQFIRWLTEWTFWKDE